MSDDYFSRPNLQPDRCLVGTEFGILVGSFVTKSESLWSLITQGRARGSIDSLFKETLASWRDARSVMGEDVGSIAPALAKVFQHKNVRQRYLRLPRRWASIVSRLRFGRC